MASDNSPTTIGVSPAVRNELDDRRDEHDATSYDDVLRVLFDIPRRDDARPSGPDPQADVPVIHISPVVHERLDEVKRERGAASYDEALRMELALPPRQHDREARVDYGPLDGENGA